MVIFIGDLRGAKREAEEAKAETWPSKLKFSPSCGASSVVSFCFLKRLSGYNGGNLARALSGFYAVSFWPTVAACIGKKTVDWKTS